MSEPSRSTASAPTVLAGRYRLERLIGQGGMAEVWEATDTALSRQVAVKLLKPQLAHDPVVGERFRREAIAAAKLNHPNVVAVHDTIDDGGRQAVVMQFIKGRSLRQLLDEQRRLTPEQTAHIGACVAAALGAAHRAGMVHRDVKPGNILLTPEGRVLLADFGIAKAIGGGEHDLTSDNIMMGTAKYLSPEQVRGQPLDGRSDLYALGLVLYECLAGQVPFQGESDADTALARLQRDPTDLTRLRPTLPQALVDTIHQLLSREPADRPRHGTAVQRVLTVVAAPLTSRTSQRETSVTSPIADPTPPFTALPEASAAVPATNVAATTTTTASPRVTTRRSGSLALIGVALLALVALAMWWWWPVSDTTATEPVVTAAPGVTVAPPPDATFVAIRTLRSYDPMGDGVENDDQLGFLLDGDPGTGWTTACYESRYLGAKAGVGVIVEMDRVPYGQLAVMLDHAPWQLQVYLADAVPDRFEGWGTPVGSDFSTIARSTTVLMDGRGRYALLWLREVGRSEQCPPSAPFQGRLSSVTLDAVG
jgi:eukaryotic-like serine/threonine-protein kinase